MAEARQVETESATYLDQLSRYYIARAKIISKIAKYPHVVCSRAIGMARAPCYQVGCSGNQFSVCFAGEMYVVGQGSSVLCVCVLLFWKMIDGSLKLKRWPFLCYVQILGDGISLSLTLLQGCSVPSGVRTNFLWW